MRWVTFLSDYGLDDSFVGVCHGVIARIAPEATVIDLCHQIMRQDVEQGALTLAASVPYMPLGVHLALVDPVTAVASRPIAVQSADGAIFVSPDNGLTSRAWLKCGGPVQAVEITNSELFLPRPSHMFRGRDIFAPVAARLATGLALEEVGPQLELDSLVTLSRAVARVHGDHVHGEVAAVDHFGNLALNMARSDLEAAGLALGDEVDLRVGGRSFGVPLVVTFGEVAAGKLAVCEDAFRRVTVAVNLGSASKRLRAARGDAVVVGRMPRPVSTRRPGERIGVLDPPPSDERVAASPVSAEPATHPDTEPAASAAR